MKITDLKGYNLVGTPTMTEALAAAEPKKDLLQKASDIGGSLFPGTKAIGESLGTVAAAGVQALKGNSQGAKEILNTQVSVPRLIGAYAAAGSSALGGAGVGTAGKVLPRLGSSTLIGAGMAGGDRASKGGSVGEVAKSALGGAVTGAAVSGTFMGAEQALKGLQSLPQRLVRSATGQSKTELLAGKDISKYVLENKRLGTAEQLIRSSQKAIDQADTLISKNLASVTDRTIPLKDIVSDIATSINSAGGEIDDAGVRSILDGLAPQVKKTLQKEVVTLAEANQLRSQLDKTLGNRAFISAQLPYNKGILMDFTNAVREQVKANAPEGTRAAFNTYAKEIKLRDLLEAKVAGSSRNQLIGLGDLISGGFGGAIGGLPGAALGAGARRAVQSTPALIGSAIGLQKLDQTLTPIISALEPQLQTAIINAINQAFTDDSEEGTRLNI